MPLEGFDKVKRALNTDIYNNLNSKVRKVYFKGLRDVIKETPVDNGRAKGNWFISTTSPSTEVKLGKSSNVNASFAQLNKIPEKILGNAVYFTNNLPYITKLEYGGYSKESTTGKTSNGFSIQAPNGWVRKALLRMANEVREI